MSGSTPFPLAQRLAIMLPVSIFFLVLDQWSKIWAVASTMGQPPRTYGAIFTLTYAQNMGAWGSLGATWPDPVRYTVLSVLPALVLLGLAIYALKDAEIGAAEVTACALVVAGGTGNLIDRFQLGYVRDFLYVGYGPIGTNIFNVADAVVMAGLGVLLLKNLQTYLASRKAA